MEWIIANKHWLQWFLLGTIIIATIVQFILSKADSYQTDKNHQEMKKEFEAVKDHLNKLSKVEGLERYLQPIKIESLRKYVGKKDFEELQNQLEKFSDSLKNKDKDGLKSAVKNILEIIPADPFFRVYAMLLKYPSMLEKYLAGEWKIVQVIKWDWKVEGDEDAKVYLKTANEKGNDVEYGPFKNNVISMLDKPLNKYFQIRFEGSGTGKLEMYPRSFRIGWAVASKNDNGVWEPNIGLSEYDPFFRVGITGGLEP